MDEPEWVEAIEGAFTLTETDGASWTYLPVKSEEEAQAVLAGEPVFCKYEPCELDECVDWGLQWVEHAPDYKDYKVQIDLSKYTARQVPLLYLKPGPGFGDFSHPTTRLVLSLMAEQVEGKKVLDIGCGSGILTLAALLLGAREAIGLDIDPDALVHAEENRTLNQLPEAIFMLSEDYRVPPDEPLVILMNMIRSEQKIAWRSLPVIHSVPANLFTSGVLISERDIYLSECAQRGWKLLQEASEGDWMAFHFEQNLIL